MVGWKGVGAGLRIAYSKQKLGDFLAYFFLNFLLRLILVCTCTCFSFLILVVQTLNDVIVITSSLTTIKMKTEVKRTSSYSNLETGLKPVLLLLTFGCKKIFNCNQV